MVQYRGHEIDADKNSEGQWVAIVDGDERGKPQHSKDDALRAARSFLNRSIGMKEGAAPKPTMEIDTKKEDPIFTAMRDAIRGD